MDHPACLDPDRLLADCEVRFTRRSGPGGQNRNKVETAVILIHRPSGCTAEASERRSQAENRRAACFRLRRLLALEMRTPPGAAPSPRWRARCRGGRIAINPEHDDYPALLAEALDVLAGLSWDVKAAAEFLGCTSTQLVKLLKHEPRGLQLLNEHRAGKGQPPLQ